MTIQNLKLKDFVKLVIVRQSQEHNNQLNENYNQSYEDILDNNIINYDELMDSDDLDIYNKLLSYLNNNYEILKIKFKDAHKNRLNAFDELTKAEYDYKNAHNHNELDIAYYNVNIKYNNTCDALLLESQLSNLIETILNNIKTFVDNFSDSCV